MLLQTLIKKREDGSMYVESLELHKYLEVKSRHNDWIRRQIRNYNFEEGYDFLCYSKKSTTGNNNNFQQISKRYELTIDMAKELAMVERNDKGREVRRYFIEIEKLHYRQMETNLKLGSMLLTHREKLQLTKDLFYPILEELGVLNVKKNLVHQKIIKSLFGKYENLNKLTKLTDEDVQNYKKLALELQSNTEYFEDRNQITVWDLIEEL